MNIASIATGSREPLGHDVETPEAGAAHYTSAAFCTSLRSKSPSLRSAYGTAMPSPASIEGYEHRHRPRSGHYSAYRIARSEWHQERAGAAHTHVHPGLGAMSFPPCPGFRSLGLGAFLGWALGSGSTSWFGAGRVTFRPIPLRQAAASPHAFMVDGAATGWLGSCRILATRVEHQPGPAGLGHPSGRSSTGRGDRAGRWTRGGLDE
jgi:hypothetical protein